MNLADVVATRRRRPAAAAAAASDPRTGVIAKLFQLDARDLPKIDAWLDHLLQVQHRRHAHPTPTPVDDITRRMTALHAYAAAANHRANLASERFHAVLCKCAKASLAWPASSDDADTQDDETRDRLLLAVNEDPT